MPFDWAETNEVLDEPILSLEEIGSVVLNCMADTEIADCVNALDQWGGWVISNDLFRIGTRMDYLTGIAKKMKDAKWAETDVDALEAAFDWCLEYQMKDEAERVGEVVVMMDTYAVPRAVALCRIFQEVL